MELPKKLKILRHYKSRMRMQHHKTIRSFVMLMGRLLLKVSFLYFRYLHFQPIIDVELSRQYPAVWKAMEDLVDSGKVLAIGVYCPYVESTIAQECTRAFELQYLENQEGPRVCED